MVTGTLVNYYFHCKRQCYFHGNRINLEDNEENVKIGKALHEMKLDDEKNSEISFENIKIDKISSQYVTEIKKSDADPESAKWQLLFYLYKLKNCGLIRKGKLQFIEKNKKIENQIVELTEENEEEIQKIISEIEELIKAELPPKEKLGLNQCKKCAYYSYCYI